MTPGQKFLKAKLAELDQLRKTQDFREYKFAIAGPNLTMWEKVQGLGSLNALAYLYMQTDGFDDVGKDTDLEQIKRAREKIQEVLSTSP